MLLFVGVQHKHRDEAPRWLLGQAVIAVVVAEHFATLLLKDRLHLEILVAGLLVRIAALHMTFNFRLVNHGKGGVPAVLAPIGVGVEDVAQPVG